MARRRQLALVALAVVSVGSALFAFRPVASGAASAPSPTNPTPVLSARRVAPLLSGVVADARLDADLDAAMASTDLGPGRDASCLVASHGARTIYSLRPDASLIPASTLKVLTGTAALAALGPDARFVTEARAVEAAKDGVLDGPLWLVGAGDPVLSTLDYLATFRNQPQVATSLETLADRIVAAGVREIRGGVIGDGARFDDERFFPTWRANYVTDGNVGPVDSLVVNDGFLERLPRAVPTSDPPEHAAAVLSSLLEARTVVIGAAPSDGPVPAAATERVAAVRSPPLRDIVGAMLRESDNNTAEMLVKELGARRSGEGSWAAGVPAMHAALTEAGLPVAGLTTVDGSGLDRRNRLTCQLLQTALARAGEPVVAGLAVAGRTGTLSDRFAGSPVVGRLRAKTGSLRGVAGLVGHVESARGGPVAFSLLVNELPTDAAGRALQRRVAEILATYPAAPDPKALGPLPAAP